MQLVVTQINWDGRGNNRSFNYWPDWATLPAKLEKIARAYDFSVDRTKVELDGNDITARVSDLKY